MQVFKKAGRFCIGVVAGLGVLAGSGAAQADTRHWSGIYVGVHAGGAWSDATATDTLPFGGFYSNGPLGNTFDIDASGFMGGAQIGIQFQSGRWVYGAELSYSWTDLEKQITSPYFPGSDTEKMSIGPILAVTGKLGYSFDQWLAYVKGGYAGGDVEFSAFDRVNLVGYKQDGWHNGWTVGAGLEFALGSAWSLGVEYNYFDLGSKNGRGTRTDGFPESFGLDADLHAVTARLNYQFGLRGAHGHGHGHDSLK